MKMVNSTAITIKGEFHGDHDQNGAVGGPRPEIEEKIDHVGDSTGAMARRAVRSIIHRSRLGMKQIESNFRWDIRRTILLERRSR
ncbi:MAG: hypothetical protein ABEL76_02085 [Bradymonadaceae bacterium]